MILFSDVIAHPSNEWHCVVAGCCWLCDITVATVIYSDFWRLVREKNVIFRVHIHQKLPSVKLLLAYGKYTVRYCRRWLLRNWRNLCSLTLLFYVFLLVFIQKQQNTQQFFFFNAPVCSQLRLYKSKAISLIVFGHDFTSNIHILHTMNEKIKNKNNVWTKAAIYLLKKLFSAEVDFW